MYVKYDEKSESTEEIVASACRIRGRETKDAWMRYGFGRPATGQRQWKVATRWHGQSVGGCMRDFWFLWKSWWIYGSNEWICSIWSLYEWRIQWNTLETVHFETCIRTEKIGICRTELFICRMENPTVHAERFSSEGWLPSAQQLEMHRLLKEFKILIDICQQNRPKQHFFFFWVYSYCTEFIFLEKLYRNHSWVWTEIEGFYDWHCTTWKQGRRYCE